ncbi:hypothetical protein JWG45_13515 [Leptospira sp. 201903070]|jgi:hypothetical protein|uniref:Uncharacterized protein n=1 Tax=Leptospira ainlahdjerensis TaxID=2810033 RepID=A0ABS2UCS7_9LEPT|nr:hypothetical protein [Leptospira ainlahdjerensis]MBM9578170.1 hypothetical protein [Leptospira ainlahdjerensis]
MVLFKSIFIFTILILSETELKLISEQIDTNSTKSEGKLEYTFENTKEGAQFLSQKMKELRGSFPSDECIVNLSRSDEGHYDKWVRDTPKHFGDIGNLNHLQLADLCKKAHRKE